MKTTSSSSQPRRWASSIDIGSGSGLGWLRAGKDSSSVPSRPAWGLKIGSAKDMVARRNAVVGVPYRFLVRRRQPAEEQFQSGRAHVDAVGRRLSEDRRQVRRTVEDYDSLNVGRLIEMRADVSFQFFDPTGNADECR